MKKERVQFILGMVGGGVVIGLFILFFNQEGIAKYFEIVGSIATAGALIYTIFSFNQSKQAAEEENRVRRENTVDNTFFNLLTIFKDIQSEIQENELRFLTIIRELKEEQEKETDKLYHQAMVDFVEAHSNDLQVAIAEEQAKGQNDLEELLEILAKGLEAKQYYDFVDRTYYKYNVLTKAFDYRTNTISDILDQESTLFQLIQKMIQTSSNRLPMEQAEVMVERVLEPYHARIGHYFRLFHRMIKYINEEVETNVIKKNYIGFLRAILNEDEILVLFYNAFYTKKGTKMQVQLMKTNFFGDLDNEDLPVDQSSNPAFFDRGKLLFDPEDIVSMRKRIT